METIVKPDSPESAALLRLKTGEDSQIFLGLESPGDMDSDFSGERGKEAAAGVAL